MLLKKYIYSTTFAFLVLGCEGVKPGKAFQENATETATETETIDPDESVRTPLQLGLSVQPKLKFKRHKIFKQEVMATLSLLEDEICTELGELDCFSQVHHLSLGGVDPYEKNIWHTKQPFLETTPIVVERIIWNACQARIKKDLQAGEGRLFEEVSLTDVDHISAQANTWYKEILAREPTQVEVEHFVELAEEINSARGSYSDFAGVSCLSMMTSVEFLFY